MATVKRHHDVIQVRRVHLDAFDRAQHRNRRRDGAVAVEQRRADSPTITISARRLLSFGARRLTNASNARMPPSP